ncbi:TPA: transposase [Pseudomonas aeruginosa]|uniref:transposase n=1 Tax=Pseudomonas aeruginosa TaxID=287 RepID=UPI001ED9B721|nr:transposase [Pseudomonas aeruginosa]MDU0518294.1 transposase [Pseudomonas aeruginosa]
MFSKWKLAGLSTYALALAGCGTAAMLKSFSSLYAEPSGGQVAQLRIYANGMVRAVPGKSCIDWNAPGALAPAAQPGKPAPPRAANPSAGSAQRQPQADDRLPEKAQLKTLWTAGDAWQWRTTWRQWLRLPQETQVPALMQFAKRLSSYWRGILSRVRWPMHTGQLEGINNRIKVIKRMAYGYRDSEFSS